MAFNYKIALVGDGGVGKSTYVSSLAGDDFENIYKPTLGVEVHLIKIDTSYGTIIFNVWDCAGTDKFGGLRDGYYIQSDGAIVMFSLTDSTSYENVKKWKLAFDRVCMNKPVVVCGNKADVLDKIDVNPEFVSISSQSCHNYKEPLLTLAKSLTGHQDLVFC